MITIKELTPKRIPGRSSLFVSFDYKPEIVAIMKECTPNHYDKKTKIWEIPATRLSKLINMGSKYDDVDVHLQSSKKFVPKQYQLSKYKTTPYDYQLDGIQFGLNHDKWLLLDSPGLGKTLQIIYLAQELKKRENIQHCLIVCGLNTLKTNWEKEIKKHSNLSCTILGKHVASTGNVTYGSVKDRLNQLKHKINEFFVIVNIETLRDDEIVKQLKAGRNRFDMIVLDECHVCKSHTSQQGKNLLKLTDAKYRIGLTGTLLLNNPLDCYVPLKWIGAERASYTNFRYQYCTYGGQFGNDFQGYKNIDSLKEQINEVSLRRTKDLLDLPEKTIIDEFLDMPDRQFKFYNNIKEGIIDEVDKVHMSTANLLAMIARLRQATACPSILTSESIPSIKMERCKELIEQITSNGHKVVVFSSFKKTLDELSGQLQEFNPLVCHGDISDDVISSSIDAFQNTDYNKVMLCTHQKMGTGVTLTAASYAIFIDQPWTDGAYTQACDRIHRIGSKDPVFIYNLICNDTFDTRVSELVKMKGVISDYVIDDQIDSRTLDILKQYIKELK